MIYTVTFNPSLDYFVTVDDFKLGRTNRTMTESMMPGGKGINVSAVLHNLGIATTALGFIAGFTGEEIRRKAMEMGFGCEFIDVEHGYSRINMKLKDYDGTEINGKGPDISTETLDRLLLRLDHLKEGDGLVLAGSIPGSIPASIYRDIMERLQGRGILFVVDATGDLLMNVLEYHPFLIKPNHHELGEIFGVELRSREDVVPYAGKLQEKGARNVLVSMSGQGAVLAAEDGQVYMLPAPEGRLINAVGAGDSMVAGFLAGWMQQKDYGHAFRLGVAAGSATAFSDLLATREDIQRVYDKIGD
ncbi:MAG: 1-phosphofructokinase [Lachnospiraceae bacterium]|nr:1-phosphofructokinase [Lachnospiraceae bacterium]